MIKTFGATFSGPDLVALTEAAIDAAPYARGMPAKMRHKMVEIDLMKDWRDRLLGPSVVGLSVSWGRGKSIERNPEAIAAYFPDVAMDPSKILEYVARLPFEVAVLPILRDYWLESEYRAPAIGRDHALLGWGMIFKGAGHERSIVSRRYLEHGPWRVVRGPEDTTLVQFHDLAADDPTSLEQARPAHEYMVAGFMRPDHRFAHDIQGLYSKEDRLLRIVVNDREVSDRELLDACVARRDGKHDKDRPLANIAYVFVDERAARARLDALWLRELECRVADGRGERRLDENHRVAVAKPAWVTALERS